MAGLDNERFYPAPPGEVFDALLAAGYELGWRTQHIDDYARAVTVSTRASGFSWGATFGAQVVPADGGAVVRVGGAQRVRVNLTAKGAEFRNTLRLLDQVSVVLQRED